VNVPLWINGRKVVPDFRWPKGKLVVEADGRTWHGDPLSREDDAERQALLESQGERVERITWAQATAGRAEAMRRLRTAAAERLSG
jgi:very-short-patch-repair endonuclease